MDSGRAHNSETSACQAPIQSNANELEENHSEHSSDTCRKHSCGSQEKFWPAGVPRQLPSGLPLCWETDSARSHSADVTEAFPHGRCSSNASDSFWRDIAINFDLDVKALQPTGHKNYTYKRNPLLLDEPTGSRSQQIGHRNVRRPSLQFPITAGTIGKNKLSPAIEHIPLHKQHININGQLPNEHPQYKNMEEDATQRATQPFMDERRDDHKILNEMDEGDIICVLHPASVAACRAVELIASVTPQHILQNQGLSYILNPGDTGSQAEIQPHAIADHQDEIQPLTMAEHPAEIQPLAVADHQGDLSSHQDDKSISPGQDIDEGSSEKTAEGPGEKSVEGSVEKKVPSKDIALRLSSRLRDPCMGFIFGRGPNRCDLMLSTESEYKRRISGSHFRIYFNHLGVLMLQDTSTNGISVDKHILKGGKSGSGSDSKRMIAGGEIIEIPLTVDEPGGIRFIVTIPRRDSPGNVFAHNLTKYIAWRDQEERRAEVFAQAAVNGRPHTIPPVYIPFNPFNDPIQDLVPSSGDAPLSNNLGGGKYNYGMEWSGGDRFNVVGYIGRGAFANVYKLATKRDGDLYAAKQIEKRHFIKNNTLDNKIHNEMHIMRKLCHPNIVQFVDHHDELRHLYIIMEFIPGGDLTSFIKAGTAMAEYMCQLVAQQICDAVDYLHRQNVTHRDIKPDNILIHTRDPLVVKLSDFGLSKWIADEETFLKSFCGTLLYCAPEIYPEYELYKVGVQGKRARNKNAPLKTSPYKPSVDTWALGAVLYHLLCGTPPFRGGLSDDRGSSMLEIVMTVPLDLGRLRNAGVSDEGIDFVSKMIVVDPAGRSTEAELLKHRWITKIGHEDSQDVQMTGGPSSLGYVEDNQSELDASQLSLADNISHREIDDSEEELTTDVEEAEGGRQSKRFKLDDSSDELQPSEDASADHVNYPLLPGMLTDSIYSEPAPVPTTQRLFGEIGASALRSSGVLGYDAHAALQMPFEGSPDESFDTSESWIDDARIISDGGALPIAQYPQLLRGPTFTGSAASLLGTEALVGQLNMASLDSGASAPSSVSTFETPQTPKSRDASLVPAGPIPGSKGSSQVVQTTSDQTTPKQKKQNSSDTRSPHHGVTSPLKNYCSPGFLAGGDIQRKEPELSQPAKPTNPSSSTATAGEKLSADGGEAKSGVDKIGEAESVADKTGEASIQASENALKSQAVAGITSVSNLSQASGRPSPPSFPKPPPRFGTLTALPGSAFNTTIRLERRITYYGRDPSAHVRHLDLRDTRVPKNALDIIFWRPGIEAMIESGKEWSSIEDLYAIAHTRTSQSIKVNGVKLTKGEGCWNYGRLHTGDIITIFSPHEGEKAQGKAAEYLKFRCEFFLGLSAKPREKGGPRFVVEKEEEKFMQNQMRRSMSSISQGSKSSG